MGEGEGCRTPWELAQGHDVLNYQVSLKYYNREATSVAMATSKLLMNNASIPQSDRR